MAWIPLALQVLPLVPDLINSGIKIADALMQDPAVSDDEKAALKAKLDEVAARLNELVDRVKASKFPGYRPPA